MDDDNYVFQGHSIGVFTRTVSGRIKLSKNRNFANVVGFEMKEFGQLFHGVMNEYLLLFLEAGRALRQEFRSLHFGDAALGAIPYPTEFLCGFLQVGGHGCSRGEL